MKNLRKQKMMIKQLFCKHEWFLFRDYFYPSNKNKPESRLYQCKKCGRAKRVDYLSEKDAEYHYKTTQQTETWLTDVELNNRISNLGFKLCENEEQEYIIKDLDDNAIVMIHRFHRFVFALTSKFQHLDNKIQKALFEDVCLFAKTPLEERIDMKNHYELDKVWRIRNRRN